MNTMTKIWALLGSVAGFGLLMGGVVGNGLLIGSMILVGVFWTLAEIPGFWKIAHSKLGGIILSVGTGFLVHKIMPGSTVTAIVAVGWAFCGKQISLGMARKG